METLQRTANRGSISTGYDIENSYKNENDNVEKMTHTYDSAPTSQQKGTISIWYKRTEINTNIGIFQFGDDASGDYLAVRWGTEANGSLETYRSKINGTSVNIGDANGAVRDTSAWYHMVIAIDTTQATATNRFRVYRNGEELTFSTDNRSSITQNANMAIGENGKDILIGEGVYRFNGYIAEVNYIDGQQLSSTDFGEYDEDSGIWIPKKYTGTYGNNGFYLDFKNASNLGEDKSGNNHDFTLNNITSANQAVDTPTNSFCTFNPLMTQNNPPTISEGAMKSTGGGGTWNQTWGNIGVKNGKWYYEFKVANSASTGYFGASTTPAEGSSTTAASLMYNTSFMVGGAARIDYYYFQNGSLTANESTGWGTISTNDVIGIALDLDSATKTFTVYKNGTALSGTLSQPVALPTNMQDEFIFPLYVQYENRADEANFGGYTISSISSAASDANGYGTFEYAPPSGYYALCTKNLAEYG